MLKIKRLFTLIGETFPDGTPYIVNPQNYFPNSQAPTGPSATGRQVGNSGGGGGGSGGYSGGKWLTYRPRLKKTCLRGFAKNTGADQPVHPRSLISAFVILFLKKIICKFATGEISNF